MNNENDINKTVYQFVTRVEKTHLPHKIKEILEMPYLKYCHSGRKTDTCMKFATIL